MRTFLSLLAISAAITVPAMAQANSDVVTVRVAVGDLDLSSVDGRLALDARIETQAREACTLEVDARYTFGREVVDEQCVAEAKAAISAQINAASAASAAVKTEQSAG